MSCFSSLILRSHFPSYFPPALPLKFLTALPPPPVSFFVLICPVVFLWLLAPLNLHFAVKIRVAMFCRFV
eukprot:jgi/Botrbrau1/483/Bobra.110_2s0120.1